MRLSHQPICIAVSFALAYPSYAQTIQINRDNKTIAISTTDEATATADIAAVTVGYEVYDSDFESAYADGGKLSHAILDALHKAGVEDKSIGARARVWSGTQISTTRTNPSNARRNSSS